MINILYIHIYIGNHCCYQLCWAKLLKQVVIRKLLNYWRSPLKCIVLEATYLLYGRLHSPSSFCIYNTCSYFCAYFLWIVMRECLDHLIIGMCNSAADFGTWVFISGDFGCMSSICNNFASVPFPFGHWGPNYSSESDKRWKSQFSSFLNGFPLHWSSK